MCYKGMKCYMCWCVSSKMCYKVWINPPTHTHPQTDTDRRTPGSCQDGEIAIALVIFKRSKIRNTSKSRVPNIVKSRVLSNPYNRVHVLYITLYSRTGNTVKSRALYACPLHETSTVEPRNLQLDLKYSQI